MSFQTLLGVTGSGKTFTMANTIARLGRPAIVFAPNKTLAAQLYSEFREFFPRNAVEYFVSYYDYYQPEAYVPQRDLFIEKDSSINEHIEQMRLSATKSLLERRDVVIVATVSAIYGIGNPSEYHKMILTLRTGDKIGQRDIIARLIAMQYTRNEADFQRGTFRVRGDTIDIFPAEHAEMAVRVELFDDEIEYAATVRSADRPRAQQDSALYRVSVVALRDAARHGDARDRDDQGRNCASGSNSSTRTASWWRRSGSSSARVSTWKCCRNWVSARASRTTRGTSRAQRPANRRRRWSTICRPTRSMLLDESHVLIGQLNGMYNGDRARKENLVDYGFRLPSALDNRPLKFNEFERKMRQAIFVSATPADYENQARRGRWPNNWCVRPAWSIRKSKCVRRAPRSTTCSARSTSASRWASACWSRC